MIAFARPLPVEDSTPSWHRHFLSMVPTIRRNVRFAFRKLDEEAKEDAVVEAVANAFVAYLALYQRGREKLAYPTVLARYAIAQFRAGRRVGNRMNRHDVFSCLTRRRQGLSVQQSSEPADDREEWLEAIVEDPKTAVPDQAAFRCDFPAWLSTHEARNRGIAKALAVGDSTREVAKRFGVSPGRVSQLRSELHDSWQRFHGDEITVTHEKTPQLNRNARRHGAAQIHGV